MILSDYLYRKASQQRVPLMGTFELSPVCNFSCKMCYVRRTMAQISREGKNLIAWQRWLELAQDCRREGMLFLLLTGGEPFLYPGFRELYTRLHEMGIILYINTNGTMIDEETMQWLKQYAPARVNITLYGSSRETYQRLCGQSDGYDRATRAIRLLKEAGIPLVINASMIPENAGDLESIMETGRSLGINTRVATYMFPPIRRDPTRIGENERLTPEESAQYQQRFYARYRDPESYHAYLQSIANGSIEPPGLDEGCIDPIDGKIRCRAGRASFWITWDGWLTPCGMMPEPKADLKTLSFGDAWKATVESANALRLSGVCADCPNLQICHPCAAIAYAETGSVSGIPTYMCKVSQEMYRIACQTLHIEDKAQSPIPGK